MGGVIVKVEVVWVIAHPISAHGVEGRGRCESGQINLSIKQGHHVRSVPIIIGATDNQIAESTVELLIKDPPRKGHSMLNLSIRGHCLESQKLPFP